MEPEKDLFEELKSVPIEVKKTAPQVNCIKTIYDKYRGVIWGCAITDSVHLPGVERDHTPGGACTNYVSDHTPGGACTNYVSDHTPGGACTNYVSDHTPGASSQMVLLMDSVYFDESNIMRVDNKLFASKLVTWRYNGSDKIDSLTAKLTAHPRFTIEPQIVALEVYKSLSDDTNHGDEALMRIAPLAFSKDYLHEILEHCITTHYDCRCVFTCIMQCDIIRYLIKHGNNINTNIIDRMYESASGILDTNYVDEVKKYYNLGMTTNVVCTDSTAHTFCTYCASDLAQTILFGVIDDEKKHTLVSFAVMLWALRAAMAQHSYSSIIKIIIIAGSDVSIAGAVLGAWFGYSKLPSDWINATPHKELLDKKMNDFLNRTK